MNVTGTNRRHTGESIHDRGDIEVTTLVCVPCKKKHGGAATCYAHSVIDGVPTCIFCEDGEPCIHEQRLKRAASQAPPVMVASGPSIVPRLARSAPKFDQVETEPPAMAMVRKLHSDGLEQEEIIGALVHLGFKMRDAKSAFEKFGKNGGPSMQTVQKTNGHAQPASAIRICGRPGCGKKLRATNESGYCAKHFADSKRKGAGLAGRICATPGCGRTLRADNIGDTCLGCRTKTGKRRGRPKKTVSTWAPARKIPRPIRVADQRSAQFALQVTEAQLDRFLKLVDWNVVIGKLPAELKLTLANHYFAAGLDQDPKGEAKAEVAAA